MISFGLGDLAYYAFRPFVYMTDAIWGTDLKDCDRCKERRARWNSLPYSQPIALTFLVTLGVLLFLWWK